MTLTQLLLNTNLFIHSLIESFSLSSSSLFHHWIIPNPSADVLLNNPTRWRYKTGHEVDPDADWLADWDMIALASGPKQMHKGQYNDGYCVQLGKALHVLYIYIYYNK